MATTIHVGNLSFKLDEEDLKKFFSKYGKVTDSYVVRRGGRPKGYGFVEFDSSQAADNALSANGTFLDERRINIEKAKGKIVKSNFSDAPPPRRNFGGNFDNNNQQPNRNRGYLSNNYSQRFNNDDGGQRRFNNNNEVGQRRFNDDDGGQRRFNNDGPRRFNNDGPRRYNNGPRYGGGGGGYNGPNRFGTRRTLYSLRPQGTGPRRNGGNRFRNGGNRDNKEREKEKSLTTVYVSNLPFSIDDAQLAKIFNKYKVKTTHVVQSLSGRSRGYGFVEFETVEDQDLAIKEMDGQEVKGSDEKDRKITVKVALVEKPSTGTNKSEESNTPKDSPKDSPKTTSKN